MKLVRKGILTLGMTTALAGAFVVANPMEAEAAGWEPRTVDEVEAEIQESDTESSYTIQWGDTLGTIATAFDVSLDEVIQVNEISDQDLIIAGNTLHLSADHKTVSIEDNTTNEVQTYDVSEEQEEVVEEETVEEEAVEEPAEEESTEEATPEENVENEEPAQTADLSTSEADAKAWIAHKESTDNYNATNGRYIGKYQLDQSYLDGDHSPANQERVAEEYVANRYGSWAEAKAFWEQNGWY